MKLNSNLLFQAFCMTLAFVAILFSCQSKKEVSTVHNTQILQYDPAASYQGTRMYYLSEFQKEGRSDREALQAMFDAVPEGAKSAVFNLQGQSLVLDGTVYYHKGLERRTKIIGNNARIQMNGDHDILVEDKGRGMEVSRGSNTEDIMRWFDTFHIYDVDFVGGRTQLRIVGTLQSRIQNCRFWNAYRGVQLVFCLQAVVEQCRFQNHKLEGIVTRSGLSDANLIKKYMGSEYMAYPEDGAYFSNASGSNSQSNRTIISNCRFYSGLGQCFCVRNQASDGIRVDNCIFEGAAAQHSIYHDSRSSPTVKSFEVIAPHIEHGRKDITKSLIYARGGIIEIKGMYSQYGECVQVDADGQKIVIERPRYLVYGKDAFKPGKSQKWRFEDTEMNTEKLADPNTWVGNVVPREAIQISHTGIIALNKIGMGFQNALTGATMKTFNANPNLPTFTMKGDQDKGADFEHNIRRVTDWNTILKEQGQGTSIEDFEVAGAIPVYAYEKDGDRRMVYWPLIGKK